MGTQALAAATAAMGLGLAVAAARDAGAVAAATDYTGARDWELVWSDEFDGPGIDRDKWTHVVAGDGFGNNELQFYTERRENSYVENGCLVIAAREEVFRHRGHTSAKMVTRGKAGWTYGRIAVRARLPSGKGIWPAVWMMPPDHKEYGGWPACGEIDIMEMVGHEPSVVHGTLHFGKPHAHTGRSYRLREGSFADDFHVFAIEWLPGEMRWYVDDELYQVQNDWFTSSPGKAWPAPFERRFFLQLNVAVGGNWPGRPDGSTHFPQFMRLDYVRVYRYRGRFPLVPRGGPSRAMVSPGLDNGSFDEGDRGWKLDLGEGASASMRAAGGSLSIQISRSTSLGDVRLVQEGIRLSKGRAYRARITGRASPARRVSAFLGVQGPAPAGDEVELAARTKELSLQLAVRDPDTSEARLVLGLGGRSGKVTLEGVSVEPLPDVALEPLSVGGGSVIEAEWYDRMHGVRAERSADGPYNLGYIDPGDWMEYDVDVAEDGRYALRFHIATPQEGARFSLLLDGRELAAVNVPRTGGWQRWKAAAVTVLLRAGRRTLRIHSLGGNFNLNRIEFGREDPQ